MKRQRYREIRTPKDVLDDINLRFMQTFAEYKPLIHSDKIEDIAQRKYLKGHMAALQESAKILDKVLTGIATPDDANDMDLALSTTDCVAVCGALLDIYDALDSVEYRCTRAEGHSGDHRMLCETSTQKNIYHYTVHWAGDMADEIIYPCIDLTFKPLLGFSNEWKFFKFIALANNLEYRAGSRSDIEVTIAITRRDFDIYSDRRNATEIEFYMTGEESDEINTSDDI